MLNDVRTSNLGQPHSDAVCASQDMRVPSSSEREAIKLQPSAGRQQDDSSGGRQKPRFGSDRRTTPVIIGSNSKANCEVKTVEKSGYLHLYRMHPNTTEADVLEFLKQTAPDIVFKCETLRKGDHSASFRLTYPIQFVDRVYNAGLWPSGAAVRRYYWRKHSGFADMQTHANTV